MKLKEIHCPMASTNFNTTDDLIDKLQILGGKTILKFIQQQSNFYNGKNYCRRSGHFQYDPEAFSIGAKAIAFILHEGFLLMKFFQTKPAVKCKNITYYDFHYTVSTNIINSAGSGDNKSLKHQSY